MGQEQTGFAPPEPTAEEKKAAKAAARKTKPKQTNDPKLVAAAQEFRDRYVEQINEGLLLPSSAWAKYDVSRALEAVPTVWKAEGAVEQLEASREDAAHPRPLHAVSRRQRRVCSPAEQLSPFILADPICQSGYARNRNCSRDTVH